MRVIVIGAGVAGLAAAKTLHEAGVQVTVLEARQRIGGRVFTDRETFGVPVEIGAQHVHGTHNDDGETNPLWQLVNEHRFTSLSYSSEAAQPIHEGTPLNAAAIRKKLEAFRTAIDEAKSEIESSHSLEDAVRLFLEEEDADEETEAQLRAILASEAGIEYAGDLDELSLENFEQEKDYDGGNQVLPGGFDQVPKALAQGLPDVRLGEIVSAIDYANAICTVTTTNGKTHQAEKVLCTLPLGVLQSQSVTFNPALPPAKTKAIARMGMGTIGKIILEFPQRFWPEDINWILSVKSGPPWGVLFSSLSQVIPNRHFLVMWHSGKLAREREAFNDDAVVKLVMQELRTATGTNVPMPMKAKITRWSTDPFSRGTYSFPKVNSPTSDIDELAKPVGNRLFFAGEATNASYFGTVHGAIISGRREAGRILKTS